MAQTGQDPLRERLARYPAERYPVQHATTQFHLGSTLLQSGDLPAALDALSAAQQVFSASGMRLEQAKASVMVGVALRTAGRADEAAVALREAASELAQLDAPSEHAAAVYDLGLVLHDAGDTRGAQQAWAEARELFLVAGHPAQAAAAARDQGGSLLTQGDAAAALPLLELATALSERGGDDMGTAAAANVLGLAHLAVGDTSAAEVVLRRALGFAPRTVRPADHAMVKANLALCLEADGQAARARLAAMQSLAVPQAPPAVRAQAREVLQRLGGPTSGDLHSVLDAEDPQGWPAVVREEIVRATTATAVERTAVLGAFLDGVLVRPGRSYDLMEALLQVVLELPPPAYSATVTAVVAACAGRPDEEVDRLRAVVSSALARFAIPQWQRLSATLNEASTASGQPAQWR